MSSATLVSLSEYLATSYRPDRDYIDGQLLDRNVGEWDHSWLQGELLFYLAQYRAALGLFAVPEQRIQVSATRFRIPDISVVRGHPHEQIVTSPPFICIEILSPDDSMTSMQERIDDYLAFGVENIWLVDPRRRKAFWADASGIHQFANQTLTATATPLNIELNSFWRKLPITT